MFCFYANIFCLTDDCSIFGLCAFLLHLDFSLLDSSCLLVHASCISQFIRDNFIQAFFPGCIFSGFNFLVHSALMIDLEIPCSFQIALCQAVIVQWHTL